MLASGGSPQTGVPFIPGVFPVEKQLLQCLSGYIVKNSVQGAVRVLLKLSAMRPNFSVVYELLCVLLSRVY